MSNQEMTETIFLEILSEAKTRILRKDLVAINSGDEFEEALFEIIKSICVERGLREGEANDFRRTGKQTFPDIIIGSFGIEVKFTTGDSWISTGNSITESTRAGGLQRIYMFFYKKGGIPDAKFRPYEECLNEIVVTHSPRYKINMELGAGDSIFEKMGVSYQEFCEDEDPIRLTKEHYRRNLGPGEELWWIDTETVPILKNFHDLDKGIQKKFQLEAMIYYPEVFSKSRRKYIKPAMYLLQEYQAICSSLRDLFSASGKKSVTLRTGAIIKVPMVLFHLYKKANDISAMLTDLDIDEQAWLDLIDENNAFDEIDASEIYRAGLRA